jgi:hypothetical protein
VLSECCKCHFRDPNFKHFLGGHAPRLPYKSRAFATRPPKISQSFRHCMIHHQNADTMVLASAHLRGIPPLDIRYFEYYQGGECLTNTHWLGPWRQHLMTNHGLRQNHRKIIGKTKKSAFCAPYSVIRRLVSVYGI